MPDRHAVWVMLMLRMLCTELWRFSGADNNEFFGKAVIRVNKQIAVYTQPGIPALNSSQDPALLPVACVKDTVST